MIELMRAFDWIECGKLPIEVVNIVPKVLLFEKKKCSNPFFVQKTLIKHQSFQFLHNYNNQGLPQIAHDVRTTFCGRSMDVFTTS